MQEKEIKNLLTKLGELTSPTGTTSAQSNPFTQDSIVICFKDSITHYAGKESSHPGRTWTSDEYVILDGNNVHFTQDIKKATNFEFVSGNQKILELVLTNNFMFEQKEAIIQIYKPVVSEISFTHKEECKGYL